MESCLGRADRRRAVVARRWRAGTIAAVALVVVATCGIVGAASAPAPGIASVTDYATPGSHPWGTAFDRVGRVWVALPGCDPAPTCSTSTPPGKIALFDPGTQTWTTTVSLPPGYGQPLFVAVDPSGTVWFTMPVTNAIGAYDPGSNTVTQWPVPTGNSGPWGLAVDHTGTVWFTEHYVNKIASFDPVTRQFREIPTPATNSNPYGIAVDASNNIWFTENTDSVALIGKYTTGGVLNEYKIRNTATAGTGLTPHLITIDGSGNPWWSEGWVSAVGTLNVATARPGTNAGVKEFHYTPACGSCGSHTSGIAADSQGLIWLDDSLQNTFGSLPVGGGAFSFYASPKAHPHDGLNVDTRNHVWFDEEVGNALAEAIPNAATTTTTTGGPAIVGSGVVVDGFGGPHPFSVGGAPAPSGPFVGAPYWPGWDIVRGVVLQASSTHAPWGGYELDGWGALHPFGMQGHAPTTGKIAGPYWAGWDIARGVGLLPSTSSTAAGGFILDGWGGLHWFSIGTGAIPAPTITESPGTYTPGRDLARGVFILPNGSGGYVVDAFGGLHPFAINGAAMPTAVVGGGSSWVGWDIARGAALAAPTNGLLLDGFGGLHPFWLGNSAVADPVIAGAPYWPGWAIARGVAM